MKCNHQWVKLWKKTPNTFEPKGRMCHSCNKLEPNYEWIPEPEEMHLVRLK